VPTTWTASTVLPVNELSQLRAPDDGKVPQLVDMVYAPSWEVKPSTTTV